MSEQLALFADDASAPRGLRYQPSFITTESEQKLIAQIRALPLAPFQFGAFEGKRASPPSGGATTIASTSLNKRKTYPRGSRP